MNRLSRSALLVAVVLAAAGTGFLAGQRHAQTESRELVSGLAEKALADTLFTLRYIERGETAEARKLLQAQTNGQLSWIIESKAKDYVATESNRECAALNTLKAYRAKNQLFVGKEWEHLWLLPGMKEEEEKRVAFLNRVNCQTSNLFKLDQ